MPAMRGTNNLPKPARGILLVLTFVLMAVGCQKRTPMATAPVVIVPASVENHAPAPAPEETKPEPVPSENPQPPPAVPIIPAPKKKSRRKSAPTTSISSDAPAPIVPAKPVAPQISPQITPEAQAAIQQKAQSQIVATEKNLAQAGARQLNSSQRDLAAKIRSFLSQAQTAAASSDWMLASNLAQKALVLSQELLDSF